MAISNPFIALLSQGLASASAKQSPTMQQGYENDVLPPSACPDFTNVQNAGTVRSIYTKYLSTIHLK